MVAEGRTDASALDGQRVTGSVRTFKGTWGFLVSDCFDGDCFVGLKNNPHLRSLAADDQVEFEVQVSGAGKAEAIDVTVLGGELGGEEIYIGRVRSFRGDWGFINSDSIDGDIFVGLKKNPGLRGLAADDEVEFSIYTDKGKNEAINVKRLPKRAVGGAKSSGLAVKAERNIDRGERAEVSHLVGQTLTGTLKSFRDSWGFIISDDFTGDLFVHKRSSPQLAGVVAGDEVQFRIEQDHKKGGYEAVDVELAKCDPEQLIGKVVVGWVKSFRGSWGFLNSHRFVGDVFVGAKANRHLEPHGLQPGDEVEFEIAHNAKLEAIGVQRLERLQGGVQMVMMPMPMPSRAPLSYSTFPVANGRRDQVSYGRGPRQVTDFVGRRCRGQVRSFKDTWGFVVSSMFDGDLFVGTRSNPHLSRPLEQGDDIEFVVEAKGGSRTNFEAVEVRFLNSGARSSPSNVRAMGRESAPRSRRDRTRSPRGRQPKPDDLVGQVLEGQIRSFKGTWGFIVSDSFDGDLFVGTKSNSHLPPRIEPNQVVEFEVAHGTGGKLEAVNVQLL